MKCGAVLLGLAICGCGCGSGCGCCGDGYAAHPNLAYVARPRTERSGIQGARRGRTLEKT